MAEGGRGLLYAALALFIGGMLFQVMDTAFSVDFLGTTGGVFIFFAFILFVAALVANGRAGGGQQQQQQVVVVRRGGTSGGQQVAKVQCPSCTRLSDASAVFCGSCGTHLGS